MPSTLAILTSDANLLRCEIALLRPKLKRSPAASRERAVGLGYVEADNILLRKKPSDVGSSDLEALASDVVSEVLFFHAGPSGGAGFADENVMPLRFRRWMFIHHGALGSPAATRAALMADLPDFLQRQLKGSSVGEVLFFSFLKRLRDIGRMDDYELPAPMVGRLLGETVRQAEQAERAAGRVGDLSLFITNGRAMAAFRGSSAPLRYALLEGIARCDRCGITETTSDSNPMLKAHRRVRAVVLATDLTDAAGFIEVPEGGVITVGHGLDVQVGAL
jgi:glutamine amidotransferase